MSKDARPLVWGDCQPGGSNESRPCPWVTCRYHLWSSQRMAGGRGTFTVKGPPPWEMSETCALDVAEKGGLELDTVGALLGLSMQRVHQLQEGAMAKMKDMGGKTLGRYLPPYPDDWEEVPHD